MSKRARKPVAVRNILAALGLTQSATGEDVIATTDARAAAYDALKAASEAYKENPTAENLTARDAAESTWSSAWDAAQKALEAHDAATVVALGA